MKDLNISVLDQESNLISGIEKEEIDPSEILREQIILALPDYPMCKSASCACGCSTASKSEGCCGGGCHKNSKNIDTLGDLAEHSDSKTPFSALKDLKIKH